MAAVEVVLSGHTMVCFVRFVIALITACDSDLFRPIGRSLVTLFWLRIAKDYQLPFTVLCLSISLSSVYYSYTNCPYNIRKSNAGATGESDYHSWMVWVGMTFTHTCRLYIYLILSLSLLCPTSRSQSTIYISPPTVGRSFVRCIFVYSVQQPPACSHDYYFGLPILGDPITHFIIVHHQFLHIEFTIISSPQPTPSSSQSLGDSVIWWFTSYSVACVCFFT